MAAPRIAGPRVRELMAEARVGRLRTGCLCNLDYLQRKDVSAEGIEGQEVDGRL